MPVKNYQQKQVQSTFRDTEYSGAVKIYVTQT